MFSTRFKIVLGVLYISGFTSFITGVNLIPQKPTFTYIENGAEQIAAQEKQYQETVINSPGFKASIIGAGILVCTFIIHGRASYIDEDIEMKILPAPPVREIRSALRQTRALPIEAVPEIYLEPHETPRPSGPGPVIQYIRPSTTAKFARDNPV